MIKTENFVVDFHHTQDPEIISGLENSPFKPAKAATTCIIYQKDNLAPLATGNAFCVVNDQFIKAVGRKVALRKAVRNIEYVENRAEIWKAYLAACKKP